MIVFLNENIPQTGQEDCLNILPRAIKAVGMLETRKGIEHALLGVIKRGLCTHSGSLSGNNVFLSGGKTMKINDLGEHEIGACSLLERYGYISLVDCLSLRE